MVGRPQPTFSQGNAVLARSQDKDQPKLNADFKDYWFPARIIGAGATPNTYELG